VLHGDILIGQNFIDGPPRGNVGLEADEFLAIYEEDPPR